MMPELSRFRNSAADDHADNFAAIIERFHLSESSIIEQVTVDEIPKLYILKDEIFTVATYIPLPRNERFRAPLTLILTTYPVKDILKIEESYVEHGLQNEEYLSVNTVIHFKDGQRATITDGKGLNTESLLREFYEAHKAFIQTLKEKL
jgi:hypothetical protein